MQNMKKLFVLLLAAVMMMAFAACGSGDSKDASSDPNTASPEAVAPAGEESSNEEETVPEETPAAPLDLTGNWTETNASDGAMYHTAVIEGETIEVYWVDGEDDSQMLYWAGSYVAPTEATEDYSWDSVNDKTKTDSALLASGDDTKTFAYKDGVISYSVSAMGETKTVELEKQ